MCFRYIRPSSLSLQNLYDIPTSVPLIMDSNAKGSKTEDMNNSTNTKCNELKSCVDCHTTRTPCWRSGPDGPRTLCNACGIRYRKEKRAVLGLHKPGTERGKKKIGRSNSADKMGVSSKMGLAGLLGYRRDLILQEKWKRKLGEEEEAAILLMTLSCGSVYA
ncbi:hypothetical protein K2173_025462 [Erythroxylum novogranatense]|uniref:GATA-type domain-containing protein n=1 Tax=Erythroxylum novogranatense TaxID=1862640 RepID=A0AAV8SBK0_9ROSI|nr:hypothetical protein K2173_025462 [Erythroxylum novogranatense]